MESVVIVALPNVDDKVYKISSEKVPHLTLAYLGEDVSGEDLAEIITYVQHAAKQLSPFYMSVDHRGTLGPDQADVVFFEKQHYDMSRIADFRHHLMLNDTLKRVYDSVDQYPEWTPHLTLGYPETPAKEDDSDYPGLHSVSFDRIAVWLGDFEGPEFRLKYDDHAMEVAMSDMTTTERGAQVAGELFHFGTKGMKWGVRKERGKIRRGLTKANVGADAGVKVIREGEKQLLFLPQKNRTEAAGRTQNRMLAASRRVNKDPQFKGKDIKHDTALKHAYFMKLQEEAKTIYAEELGISRTQAWGEFLGVDTNAATQQMRFNIAVDKISHASDTETLLVLDFITDDDGFVTDITVPDEYLTHFEDNEYTVMHYGVKGMKWGVRTKDRAAQTTPKSEVQITQKKPGSFAKTKGGEGLPLSEDAATALELRQKGKASTTDALSNKELQTAVTRMNLEQQYSNLEFQSDRRSQGARFVAGLFGQKRYGKKRPFADSSEDTGERVGKAIKEVQEYKKAQKAQKGTSS